MRGAGLVMAALFGSSALASTGVTYYHTDALGSPVAATDAAGAVIWRARYRPFGDRDQGASAYGNSLANPVWFAGHVHDDETGLSYMQGRYYSPVLGRFMSTDPAPSATDNDRAFNRYAYANNNPYRYIDPDGRDAVLLSLKGTAAALFGGSVSAGVYVTYPGENQVPLDIGLVQSAAVVAGADISATVNLTMAPGGRENISGPQLATSMTVPLTAAVGPAVDIEHIINPQTGKSAGTSIGFGYAMIPAATTSLGFGVITFSLRDAILGAPQDAPQAPAPYEFDAATAYDLWFWSMAN